MLLFRYDTFFGHNCTYDCYDSPVRPWLGQYHQWHDSQWDRSGIERQLIASTHVIITSKIENRTTPMQHVGDTMLIDLQFHSTWCNRAVKCPSPVLQTTDKSLLNRYNTIIPNRSATILHHANNSRPWVWVWGLGIARAELHTLLLGQFVLIGRSCLHEHALLCILSWCQDVQTVSLCVQKFRWLVQWDCCQDVEYVSYSRWGWSSVVVCFGGNINLIFTRLSINIVHVIWVERLKFLTSLLVFGLVQQDSAASWISSLRGPLSAEATKTEI